MNKLYLQKNLIVISILFIISSCTKIDTKYIEPGVSIELAKLRDEQISNLKYHISFNIPDSINKDIHGHEVIEFDFVNASKLPLILDFRNPGSNVKSVKIDKQEIKYSFENEHIIIPSKFLKGGKNKIEIEFIAGNRALNRNKEYLYTLFVPDRACTAFPSFDQPSLKAKFQPEITVPNEWIAVTNSELIKINEADKNKTYIFNESEPISTYLFSFVAGKFESIKRNYDDREITMYHRETNKNKIDQNVDRIFELKYSSLEWLENYTRIDYPFKKLDFIVIPSFQYRGMEHPGAVLYRDSQLFLEETATLRDKLDRANLIAHETAHMWFGDLVTMEWFSEVWLKEVFANFIAGKIVNPQFPNINHELNFLINHYPKSYSIDRTKGANPIEQDLDNMKNAGTLYGQIIYHKAPIVMNQLESIMGEYKLQDGLQKYLSDNKYNNATWNDLINILNQITDFDLDNWSKSWVYEPGMPNYSIAKAYDQNNNFSSLIIEQSDPFKNGRQWPQNIDVLLSKNSNHNLYNIQLTDTFNVIEIEKPYFEPDYIFTNSSGLGYGYFKIDSVSKKAILAQIHNIKDPVSRCSIYISLWENMLNQNLYPAELFETLVKSFDTEKNPQNINLILGYIESTYWKFLPKDIRDSLSYNLEDVLWKHIIASKSKSTKSSFFKTYYKVATTENALNNLFKIWNNDKPIPGLNLSENDLTEIAFELSVKNYIKKEDILKMQFNRIENAEMKDRFNFIKKAIADRDNFFESLKDERNREKEPWVVDALKYLHHPLKSKESIKYIIPSLEILEELQITGDIFFPKQWLDATFSGHSTIDAVTEINLFLNQNPNFPDNLKNKILQSTDLVFRASIIKDK